MADLDGRVAVVTGAARGIGLASRNVECRRRRGSCGRHRRRYRGKKRKDVKW